MGDLKKAKELLDAVPALLDKRKLGGRDLPTEVYIKKKRKSRNSYSRRNEFMCSPVAFYKAKAKRNGGDESNYVDYMKISIAEGSSSLMNKSTGIMS